jgi:hypothetical protein
MQLTLSQVIYGVQDLDAATARITARGLTVLDGGVHPGLGTANRIVPLGAGYFELLGVVDGALARRSAYGQALLRQIADGDRLVRWSLRTDDIDRVAAERGLIPEARRRQRPDGTLLTWRAAGLDLALQHGWLPFFMQWDDPAHYPGGLPVQHACGATGIAWLELTPADPAWLAHWRGDADLPLRVVPGVAGLHRVALRTPASEMLLP